MTAPAAPAMSVGSARIALVESRWSGMECSAFPSRLSMVLAVIDNGALSDEGCYGSDGHKAALAQVEKQLADTRAKIAEMEMREMLIDNEPKTPPCQQCGAMTEEEAATKCHGSDDDCHGCRLWPDF